MIHHSRNQRVGNGLAPILGNQVALDNQPENSLSIQLRGTGAISSIKLYFLLRNGNFKPASILVVDDDTGREVFRRENEIEKYEDTVTIETGGATSITIKPASANGDYALIFADSEIRVIR